MLYRIRWLALSALFCALASPVLYARTGDQVHFGQSITVGEDETAGSLVCIGCSIRVEGASEDVVAIGGSITVDGTVRGDAVAIGGPIRLGETASVAGDVVTIGGRLWRHPDAVIKGDVSSQSGVLVLVGLFLIPLVPVILIVALIVWLVSRSRRTIPAGVRPAG
jgi:hypothetical protein